MKKKNLVLAALCITACVAATGCGKKSSNESTASTEPVTLVTEDTSSSTEMDVSEESSETISTEESSEVTSTEAVTEDDGERPAYAPISPGVWKSETGDQYIFYADGAAGTTIYADTGTGVAFEYQCTSDGYMFHFGSADDNTPTTAEFNNDGSITLTFNHSNGTVVTHTITQISDDPNATIDGAIDEGDSFLGIWGCGRATMNISTGDVGGRYIVTISWASSAYEMEIWTYQCKYSQEAGGLVSDSGNLRTEIYQSEDAEPEVTITEGQSAVFMLTAGGITWDDKVNNSGADMIFVK